MRHAPRAAGPAVRQGPADFVSKTPSVSQKSAANQQSIDANRAMAHRLHTRRERTALSGDDQGQRVGNSQQDIEQRVRLAGNNMFELLLFRLGEAPDSEQRELYGINVFKVREILAMPAITAVAGANDEILGVADIRGQIIPVIDLAKVTGCRPKNGPKILLVTEFARTTQGFAVEEVDDIVRLEWNQVLSAESHSSGRTVTSFARLDGNVDGSRLAQVLDVERIVRDVLPSQEANITEESTGRVKLKPGAKVLAADDSGVARSLIEQSLTAMGVPFVMTKTGQEAWNVLQSAQKKAQADGTEVSDQIALVLTDLEMPEMDGFTLTRRIKADAGLQSIPVVIHSSLSGSANEQHVRKVGANAYVSKFVAAELASVMREALYGT
jgi:two-component system chemotaxis response regulator CheV